MTIADPRLTQIAKNISEQHKWTTRVVWDTLSADHAADKDGLHAEEIKVLGVVDGLLTEVHKLIKIVADE